MRNLILAVLLLVTAVTAGFTQDKTNKQLLYISKTAKIEAEPDSALLTIGINDKHSDAKYLKEQSNKKINNFIARLKSIGFKDSEIKTQSYYLHPIYNWKNNKKIFQHYQISQNIKLKVASKDRIQLLAKAIDISLEEKLNNVGNIQFMASPELHSKVEKQAYKQASTDALNTAKELISNLGLNYQGIHQINLSQSHHSYARYNNEVAMMDSRSMKMSSAGNTKIHTGTTTIQATVSLQVEYK